LISVTDLDARFRPEEQGMGSHVDYFECDECRSRDFKRIYNFCLRFHGVNFSDELIYDRVTPEVYQCARCNKRFTKEQIEEGLAEFRKKRRQRKTTASEG
jgi:ribosomal protein L37AE/L43A